MVELSAEQIEALLSGERIGRLSMAGADGRPYTIPLPFCWHAGTVYLRLPLTGRKGEILRQNGHVCFEADTCTPTLDQYASVLVEGELVPVTDPAEKAAVKRANDAKYDRLRHGHRPGHGRATPLAELPLRKINVERVTGRGKTPTTHEGQAVAVAPAAALPTAPTAREFALAPGRPSMDSFLAPLAHGAGRSGQW
jgi:nitroimidazol reductase NimA-like FMN-containing flavoprotein (pyridoxamine 5'-phosphate oxidase superfamily)